MALGITNLAAFSAAPAGALQNGSVPGNTASSWQTNGIVRAIAATTSTVYIGGEFTSVRPPGAAAGTGEVARTRLAAFNSSTGALNTTFNPTINGIVRVATVSPDKTRLYIGGDFTTVNGSTRNRVAGFNLSTGALLALNTNVTARVTGLAASATTLYITGSFTTVAGQPRQRVAAVDSTSGALRTAFVANATDTVNAAALSTAGDKLYLAGSFNDINGDTSAHSAAAVNSTTGAVLALPANSFVPLDTPACVSDGKDVKVDGDSVYFANEGTGGGCFDGTYAAYQGDGTLKWRSNCLGATQGIAVLNGLVYAGSHAHDCAADMGTDPDAFPEVGWSKGFARKLTARNTSDGKISSWYPNTNAAAGGGLGPRVMGTDGTQVFVGGDFTLVNGLPQQGFARFSPSTGDLTLPARPATPIAVTKPGNKVSVYVQPPLDLDDTDLIVRLYRVGTTAPIASAPVHSLFWRQPILAFEDNGLAPGTQPRYTADAIEQFGTNVSPKSAQSVAVTVGTVPAYSTAVNADGPSLFWRLGEASGPVAADSSGGLQAGNYQGTVTYNQAGQATGDTNAAATFNGSTGFVTSTSAFPSPTTYSAEAWVKTTSTSGGKIIGFGDRQGGLDFSGNPAQSGSYDKQIYMTNDGRLVFGVYVGFTDTLTSANAYNDGQWHHVVGTQGPTGMAFYVDGVRVGRNGQSANQSFAGYWRVGGDNLNGWPNQPASSFFGGTIDDVAVYPSALTSTQVSAHYAASGRTPPPPVVPSDSYGNAVFNTNPVAFWRLDETSGTTANDSADTGITAQYSGGVNQGQAGALGAQGFAAGFDGSTGNVASSSAVGGPSSYGAELWFNTNTSAGGKLIGFGNNQTGNSGNYDKHVYMTNDGHLIFGVYNGGFDMITSSATYNNGEWHHVVANQGPSGMSLYVDDHLVGTNSETQNQGYSGYWRVGGDNLNAWPNQPTTSSFAGLIDEVAIYGAPLTPAQIDAHYTASGRSGPDIVAPLTAITTPADGASVNVGSTTVDATATDSVGVTAVSLEVDGFVVDTDTSAPYSFSWNATAGAHTLRTLASDAATNVGSSAPITVTGIVPDTTNPATAITAPTEGASVFGPTAVTADATDDTAVTSVALKVDGTSVATDTTAPYAFTWNAVVEGNHTLETVASDAAGNTGSSVIVNVIVPPDTAAPGAASGLTSNNIGKEQVDLAWSAASDDRGVDHYVVVRNGVPLPGAINGLTFTDTGLTPNTGYTYTVRAVDAAGNIGADSSSILVTTLPAELVLFSDTWTGTNGSAWTSPWTSGVTSGTADIQSNTGRLAYSDVANAFARAQLTGPAPAANTEALFSYQWSATSAVGYFSVYQRGSGGWQNGYRPRTGYGLELASNSGTVSLKKNVNGTLTTIRTISAANQVGTAKQWIRFRVSGAQVQVKIWRDGVAEPAAWTSTDTDTSVTAPGQLHLSLVRGGTNVGAKDVRIDDLTVKEAP